MLSFREFLTEGHLKKQDFKPANPERFENFYDMIKGGEEFVLAKGGTVKLHKDNLDFLDRNDEESIDNLKKGPSIMLRTIDGDEIKLTDLQKTSAFGGTGGASGKIQAEWYEESIAVEWNKLNGLNHEAAISKAYSGDKKSIEFYKEREVKYPGMVETGAAVARDLMKYKDKIGSYLTHSGKGIPGTKNHYGEKDITPKSDIYGGTAGSHLSLKFAKDSSSKAQIMSGKTGDAQGVFRGALVHMENNETVDKGWNQEVGKLVETIGTLIKEDFNSGATVGDSKKEFGNWFQSKKLPMYVTKTEKLISGKTLYQISSKTGRVEELSSMKKDTVMKHVLAMVAHNKAIAGHGSSKFQILYTDPRGKSPVQTFDEREYSKLVEEFWKSISQNKIANDIREILDSALRARKVEDILKNGLEQNEDFHKWLIYEAASGHYKFDGRPATVSGGKISGNIPPSVADAMLVINTKGVKHYEDVWKFSQENSHLAKGTEVSFKSSGKNKYLSVRVYSEEYGAVNHDLIDEIVSEEWSEFEYAMLSEGFFDTLKSIGRAAKDTLNQFTGKLVDFFKRVIQKVMNVMVQVMKEGRSAFYRFAGLEPSGVARIKTPTW